MNSFDSSCVSSGSKGIFKTVVISVIVGVFLISVFFIARSSASGLPAGIVLYWGDGCPHCANVEAFVQQNGVESKVPFTRKEVYLNKRNAREMAKAVKSCGLSVSGMGVPFLWTGSQCLTGDKDIIAFFRQAAGIGAE